MNALASVTEHWSRLSSYFAEPRNEHEYDRLVEQLDEILAVVGDNPAHELAGMASLMGDVIERYDERNRPMPDVSGADALRFLMTEHELSQSDMPEVGAQSVVSEILRGRRQINVRQARALSDRFHLPATVFLAL